MKPACSSRPGRRSLADFGRILAALAGVLLLVCSATRPTFAEGEPPTQPQSAGTAVMVALDSDWPAFLEAVPAALSYNAWDRLDKRPFISVPDLSPYNIDIETHIRDSKLVLRAEGDSKDAIPTVQESVEELRQKIRLPNLTQQLELLSSEGLDGVSATLHHIASGADHKVEPGFALPRPPGGEWLLVLRMKTTEAPKGVLRLRFRVSGWDLDVLDRFMKDYGATRILAMSRLPAPVQDYLSGRYDLVPGDPFLLRGEKAAAVVISTSYPSALVGAQIAGLDGVPHVVHTDSIERTARKIADIGPKSATVICDEGSEDGKRLVTALAANPGLSHVAFTVVTHLEAEKNACDRHTISNAVVVNPRDLGFPSHYSYPRSSLAAPIYAIFRRSAIVFVTGGDLKGFEDSRTLENIYFGVNGFLCAFQWEDIARTRKEIIDGLNHFGIGAPNEPYLTLLGGDHSIPCTFFAGGAWPKEDFPLITFQKDAVLFADASVYANIDEDGLMDAAVGRIIGNTDEITSYLGRVMFRERMEDAERYRANKALLVFGSWGNERGEPGEETAEEEATRLLKAAGGYDCASFVGSTWGGDFLRHIGGARVFFANDFGYHNAGWGWSSYAHKGYQGPESNYNTQNFPMDFDAGYCVASSNGCATCDDKNRDNLHYGGNSIPLGLLFFRNGALGYFGMPHAALAEITTPLEGISKDLTLGEAIQKHVNDRLNNPKGGGLFGGRDNWIGEVPGYDTLQTTHPVLFPLTKQDALVLFGDPQEFLFRPAAGEPIDVARKAANYLIAHAAKSRDGWNLTGEEKEAEAAYGQSTAGAGIFMVHLYNATKDRRYLECAVKAAEWVAHVTEKDDDRVPGLFVGDSGKGLLYLELARATGEKKYLEMADGLVRHFAGDWVYKENKQPYWTTDVYCGAAGHILFLIEMNAAKPDPFYVQEARRAGDFLVKWAEPAGKDAWWWTMEPWDASAKELHYTGFAHGVAGIAFCLAELSRATGDEKYLEYAEGGAKCVMDRAQPLGAGWQWHAKYTPQPEKLKFQWCHGSPGMLQMFLKLFEVTGKPVYREWAEKAALTAARPGKYYRADMSLCHGAPGNGDVFIEAYRVLGDRKFLDMATDHAGLARTFAVEKGDEVYWRIADKSYMNGVAGVGHFFLRLSDAGKTRAALIAR
ncbi:MAG: glycoside hydrolase family 127 protein [Planctomycetes bacterium]|nr:glycoside hydrolase family 127 protein [Planctomycetota bacterium]